MQEIHTPKAGEGASRSRRNFITITIAAGSAATLPAVALAEAGCKTSRLPQLPALSLEQQLDICIANLKNVLAAMHPEVNEMRHSYAPTNNNRDYMFWLAGKAPALCIWDGPGLYEVRSGQEHAAGIYHIERHRDDMDKCFRLWGAFISFGHRNEHREIIEPHTIVRKVEGGAA